MTIETPTSPDGGTSAATPAPGVDAPQRQTPHRSAADRFMRRLLLLPSDAPQATNAEARKAFQTSMMVATVRCLLMYIVLPFVLPAIGFAAGVGPWLGLAISLAAIVAITMSIRRFWRADHPKRWAYTAIGSAVMVFMVYSIVVDVRSILA